MKPAGRPSEAIKRRAVQTKPLKRGPPKYAHSAHATVMRTPTRTLSTDVRLVPLVPPGATFVGRFNVCFVYSCAVDFIR